MRGKEDDSFLNGLVKDIKNSISIESEFRILRQSDFQEMEIKFVDEVVSRYIDDKIGFQKIVLIILKNEFSNEVISLAKEFGERGAFCIIEKTDENKAALLSRILNEVGCVNLEVDRTEIIESLDTFFSHPEEFRVFLAEKNKPFEESIRSFFIEEGMDFEDFKKTFIFKKILKRAMITAKSKDKSLTNKIDKYLSKFISDKVELFSLYESMDIHSSSFFFHKQVYEDLKNQKFQSEFTGIELIRIMIIGPGSGEELISILLFFHDIFKEKKYSIYSLDRYKKNMRKFLTSPVFHLKLLNNIPQKYHKYLDIKEVTFSVKQYIYSNVIFTSDNFLGNRSFYNYDFIFCQNVLTHFKKSIRDEFINKITYSMKVKGILITENEHIELSKDRDFFSYLDAPSKKIFRLLRKKKYSEFKLIPLKKNIEKLGDENLNNLKESLVIKNKNLLIENESLKKKLALKSAVMDSAIEDFKHNSNAQVKTTQDLKEAYDEISKMKDGLEILVNERTNQLNLTNLELVKSNDALLKSNQKLEKIQKERNFFFASLSHELRTPLNAILGFSKILQEIMDFEDWNSRERSFVDAINVSGRSLLRLVNSVHDFTKIELNEIRFVKSKCDISDILKPISLHYGSECTRKGLDYQLEINEKTPQFIVTDEVLLKQVLDNILNNAIKFTKVGKISIKVGCHKKDDKKKELDLLIQIEDTGVGMAAEKMETIFDSFSQIHERKNINERGSGLGLYISNKIINGLGGNLSVESKLNKGSIFTISLKNVSFSKGKIEIGDFIYSFTGSKILIVDDFALNIQLYEAYLATHNLKLETASNGKELIEKAEKFKPDLIVTDYDMPVLNAYDAIKILKEKGMDVPVILISALKIKEEVKGRFDSFLQKPIERETFIKELATFLKHTTEVFKKNENVNKDDSYELNIPKKMTQLQEKMLSEVYEKFLEWRQSMELTEIEMESKKIKKDFKKLGFYEFIPFLEKLEKSAGNFKVNTVVNLLNEGIKKIKKN